MDDFTPFASIIGGTILGIAALILFATVKRIAGVSGIIGGLLLFKKNDTAWRVMFLSGLIFGGLILSKVYPKTLSIELTYSTPALILAGLLVGFGSRIGNGCTSGHGICGLGRLQPHSMVAVISFLTTGIITATIVGTLLRGVI